MKRPVDPLPKSIQGPPHLRNALLGKLRAAFEGEGEAAFGALRCAGGFALRLGVDFLKHSWLGASRCVWGFALRLLLCAAFGW